MDREYVNEILYSEPKRTSSRLSNNPLASNQGYTTLEKANQVKYPARNDLQTNNQSRTASQKSTNSSKKSNQSGNSKTELQQSVLLSTQSSYPMIKRSELKDYLIWSIFSALFFSVLFGGLALVHSVKTRHRIKEKLFQKARSNSRKAFLFNLASLIIGSIMTVISILILVLIERSRTDAGIFVVIVVFRILL